MNLPIYETENERGSSLISGIVGLTLIAAASTGLMRLNSTSARATKASSIRLDLQDVRRQLGARLSCDKTLAAFGAVRPITCTGPVKLLTSDGSPLVPADGKVAGWSVEGRCETIAGKNGLSIIATKKNAQGGYENDPLNQSLVFDDKSPLSRLYAPEVRPCSEYFSSTGIPAFGGECPDNKVQVGMNPDTTPKCDSVDATDLTGHQEYPDFPIRGVRFFGRVDKSGNVVGGNEGRWNAKRESKGKYKITFHPKLPNGTGYTIIVTAHNGNGDHVVNVTEQNQDHFKVQAIDTGTAGGAGNNKPDDTEFSFLIAF